MRHQWKTGRHYDEYGQRMVAQVFDKHIKFSDLSRHINGIVPLGVFAVVDDTYTIESLVMTNYDFSNYDPSNTTLEWEGESK